MMYVAFTICSNNYLAKAKIVADTFLQHHPRYVFFIFLVDKINKSIDYSSLGPARIVPIENVFDHIEALACKYNIIELSTAVKPFIFLYLFKTYNSNIIIYLDPDLIVFDRFSEAEKILLHTQNNVIITPHFLSPIDDGKIPSEIDFNLYGLYNLGFIAVKNNEISLHFLKWWHSRLMKYGFAQPHKGMFTDQIWLNYAPLFFTGIYILRDAGYNVANWNLYERKLVFKNELFFVNENIRLKFFHFSHYDFNNPYKISRKQTRHTIEEMPELKMLIDLYQQQLVKNKMENYAACLPYYSLKESDYTKYQSFSRKVVNRMRVTFRALLYGHN